MLDNTKIINYYFSGTGNTELLVQEFSNYLVSKGFDSTIQKIEEGYIERDGDYILGLMFPVAIQSTFPVVWDFINALPIVNKRKVFMFDTLESFSGGIVGPVKKILKDKGYICIGAKEFRMSSSLNVNIKKVEKGIFKNEKALVNVKKYADELINDKTDWGRIPILSDSMRAISKSDKIWEQTSKCIKIDNSCIKCKKCIINCPVNAIKLLNDNVVIDHTKCNSCLRCASHCPVEAILVNNKKLKLSKIKL